MLIHSFIRYFLTEFLNRVRSYCIVVPQYTKPDMGKFDGMKMENMGEIPLYEKILNIANSQWLHDIIVQQEKQFQLSLICLKFTHKHIYDTNYICSSINT